MLFRKLETKLDYQKLFVINIVRSVSEGYTGDDSLRRSFILIQYMTEAPFLGFFTPFSTAASNLERGGSESSAAAASFVAIFIGEKELSRWGLLALGPELPLRVR